MADGGFDVLWEEGSLMQLEVIPEQGLRGENVVFLLGTPINQVIAMLQQNPNFVDKVFFHYFIEDPMERDVCIQLSNKVKIFFDAKTQRMKLIEVENLKEVALSYYDQVFSHPADIGTMEKVEKVFGSTHPGEFNKPEQMFMQSWRGLCLFYHCTTYVSVEPGFGNLQSLKGDGLSDLKIEKISIFKGNKLDDSFKEHLEVPMSCYSGQNHLVLAESVLEKNRITGVSFNFRTEDNGKGANRSSGSKFGLEQLQRVVLFGDDVTSVLAALGAPSKVFYKSEEISPNNKDRQPDFFFNYFAMGFDILFDFLTKKVIKFVLHTNIPGHYHFGIYNRCVFRIKCHLKKNSEPTPLTTFSKKSELDAFLSSDSPLVLSRHPWRQTYAYGEKQVIIEVMENSHIASLTIFDD